MEGQFTFTLNSESLTVKHPQSHNGAVFFAVAAISAMALVPSPPAYAQTPPPAGLTSVVTYHNDPQRTGWNATESMLTTANVKHGSFEFYASIALDDRIDTQPLVVGNVTIQGAVHEVVYVATEGNTIYAIDPGTGNASTLPRRPAKVLIKRSLGAPIYLPLGCHDSGGNVGINGTPTIDAGTQTMYVIAYTLLGGKPAYQLHALDIRTLADKAGSPVNVAASHTLTNGTKFTFNAAFQRQRPGLLLADGNVYAGFGSFCDFNPGSRGWLLGWNAGTLAPLPANELTDSETTAGSAGCPQNCFLSSIWMSGYGIAAETPGDLFFVTGNSGGSYNGTTNIQESVVKVAPNLAAVHHVFTPTNSADLDQHDIDFGSGGVMVVPDQPGPKPLLAVAAGKDGRLFILNRSNLGGQSNQPSVDIGACWCGPSYYRGADGVGRVVSSGGTQVKTWRINTAATPALQPGATAALTAGSQDGGFFTSISSKGTTPNTSIIWAVGRPVGTDNHVTLYAFDGTDSGGALKALWTDAAGARPTLGGNANLVPTVANGRVYVASHQLLKIAGLTGRVPVVNAPIETLRAIPAQKPPSETFKIDGAVYWGTAKSVEGVHVTIELRTGKLLNADLSQAVKNGTTVKPVVGLYVVINGTLKAGVLDARTMSRAKAPGAWGADVVK